MKRSTIASKLKTIAMGGAFAAMASSGAFAATQGTLGSTSTGTIDISLEVLGVVKISNLANVTLPDFAGVDVSQTQGACIYSNSTGGGYRITATATGGAFNLVNGANTIPYTVDYNDGSGTGFLPLTHGSQVAKSGASNVDDDCGGAGTNATVQVNVAAADASSAPQGTYTSTLTLIVAPL